MFSFDTPSNLVMGLLTGLVFGFLLQRAGVTRYRVILGQFLWTNHTVLRTMLTAVVVGSIGIYAMHQMWQMPLHVKPAAILANVLGGVIFGIGMAVLGYCPGTGVGALGDGSRHAPFGVLGMLVGATVYAEVYPWMKASLLSVGDLGEATLPDETHVSPWVFIVGLGAIAAVVFWLLRERDVRPQVFDG